MRKSLKILITALSIPVLLFLFAACPPETTPTGNPPTEISVTMADGSSIPNPFVIEIGEEVELTVSAQGATLYEWDIDDPTKVNIVSGLHEHIARFKGIAEGTTEIIAFARNKDGSINCRIAIEVVAERPVIPALVLTIKDGEETVGAAINMDIEETLPLTVIVEDEDGDPVTGYDIDWDNSDEEVVTVDAVTNTITAIKDGTSTITVTVTKDGYLDGTKIFTVMVRDPGKPDLDLKVKDPDEQFVDEGDSFTLEAGKNMVFTASAHGIPDVVLTDVEVNWVSDKPEYAEVDDGTVTALSAGTATITVTATVDGYNPASLTFDIVVTPKRVLVLSVNSGGTGSWNQANNILTILETDENVTLNVTGTVSGQPADLDDIEWEITSASGIIEIDEDGKITILKTGTTQVTVSAETDDVDPASKTITVIVEMDYTSVLFAWNINDGSSFSVVTPPATSGHNLSGAGQGWVHPDNNKFMAQKDNMRVSYLRTFAAGVAQNNAILLGANNARLAIGQSIGQATNSYLESTVDIPDFGGQIDLYEKHVRLTVDYINANTTGGYILRAYVGNNGTGAAQSIFGTTSNIATYGTAEHFGTGEIPWINIVTAYEGNSLASGRVIFDIDTRTTSFMDLKNKEYLAKTFIALHAQDSAVITITSIRLDYIAGNVTPDPLTLEVKEGESVVPNTGIKIVSPATTSALTASVTPNVGTISWSVLDESVATVSPDTGGSVTVTAVQSGTTKLTVTASADGYFTASRTFDIAVEEMPIELTISQGEEPVGASIPMNQGDAPIALSAAVLPSNAVITWTSGTPAAVTVNGTNTATGTSVNIAALAGGTSTITVSAALAGYKTEVKTFNVVVASASDPNLIWEWKYSEDTAFANSFSDTAPATGTTYNLAGKGLYTTVPMRISNNRIRNDKTNGGIVMSNIDATSGGLNLVIGSNDNASSSLSDAPEGVFNFRTNNTNGIRVIFDCDILQNGSGSDRHIFFNLSGNQGNNNTPLNTTTSAAEARIIYWTGPVSVSGNPSTGTWDAVNKKLTSKIFKPSDLNQTNIAFLEKTFIGIGISAPATAGASPTLLIRGIRIEYVSETNPPDDKIIWDWDSTEAWTAVNANNSNNIGTPAKPVRTYGARAFNNNGGIVLGGKNGGTVDNNNWRTATATRIAIGQTAAQASASGDAATINYNGQFDLLNRKIRITLSYRDVEPGGTNRDILWVTINNNGTGSDASFLQGASRVARFATAADLLAASETGSSLTSGTVIIDIDCTVAALADKETMDAAFIGLYAMHDGVAGGTGAGNFITITAIRIEYND